MKQTALVVGAGVGGISVALWLKELGLDFDWIEAEDRIGGMLHQVYNPISHLLGREYDSGAELVADLLDQLDRQDLNLTFATTLVEAEFTTGSTEVQVRLSSAGQQIGGVYQAVIIATGTARRMLGVPGEAEAQGRGIALSGRKDLERFRAQRVVVVGSGDAAFENASLIAPVANSVTLVCRTSEHHARPEFQRGAVAMPNVEILSKTVMTAVESDEGTGRLRAVVLESDGRAWRLEADVALIRIGVDARVPKATIDGQPAPSAEGGFLAANERRQVGHPRLLAVGDCARPGLRAIAMAAADGATAAHTVAELFSGRDPKT